METVRVEVRVPADAVDLVWDVLENAANDVCRVLDSAEVEGAVEVNDTLGESESFR